MTRDQPVPGRQPVHGFSLLEVLVALAVFAALAAAAYGGLAEIARARAALAERQDRFAAVVRAVTVLERDIRQAVSRPVRGNDRGQELPALIGGGDRIEFTRLGFANPLAEARSNVQRVAYALDAHTLVHARYAVLDRAAQSIPLKSTLLEDVSALGFRYLGSDAVWHDAWPPTEMPAGAPATYTLMELLPRAIEVRVDVGGLGELRRIVELPSTLPTIARTAPAGSRGVPALPTPGASGSTP